MRFYWEHWAFGKRRLENGLLLGALLKACYLGHGRSESENCVLRDEIRQVLKLLSIDVVK